MKNASAAILGPQKPLHYKPLWTKKWDGIFVKLQRMGVNFPNQEHLHYIVLFQKMYIINSFSILSNKYDQ